MNMEIPAKLMVEEILKNKKVNPHTVLDIYLDEFKKVCLNYMKQSQSTPETDALVLSKEGFGATPLYSTNLGIRIDRSVTSASNSVDRIRTILDFLEV